MSFETVQNTLQNNGLSDLIKRAGPAVSNAIHAASERTGVDFSYMMEQAAAESSFKTDIKAATSSATGLYQFIESTWTNMIKQHGHKYGLGRLADKIDANGNITDAAAKNDIMNLRKDPKTAALMAAEFAAGNKSFLLKNSTLTENEIGSTELYFAHFLGANGASNFLDAHKDNPLQRAADLFPKAANANKNVFYDMKTGKARSLAEVYEFFDKKFNTAPDSAPDARPDSPVFAAAHETTASAPSAYDAQMAMYDMQMEMAGLNSGNRDSAAYATHAQSSAHMTNSLSRILGAGSYLKNPIELMLMAQLDSPHSITEEDRPSS